MQESQFILGWERRGEARGELRATRDALCGFIEGRFSSVPPDVQNAIDGTQDMGILRGWVRAAAQANSLEELRAAVRAT
jgi:hypothetical protein